MNDNPLPVPLSPFDLFPSYPFPLFPFDSSKAIQLSILSADDDAPTANGW